nr:MAG TPA: hypothetical protein [Caudoviricetes sp.]
MTYERWIALYREAMDLLTIIDNECPFINDESVGCDCCKIQNECKDVIAMRSLQHK